MEKAKQEDLFVAQAKRILSSDKAIGNPEVTLRKYYPSNKSTEGRN